MKRKIVKLILFIFGAAVTVLWTVLFVMNMLHLALGTQCFWQWNMLEMAIISFAGLIPMSIAMLMHAYDIKSRKKGFAIFLTILSIFWLANSALLMAGMLIVSLVFGWDTYLIGF
jgi:hypothetical protein